MQKGGKFGKAAAQVSGILKLAQRKNTVSEVFFGIPTTNHGESRIQHCIKYDLQGACRLITVQHNDVCFLMFAGTHDDCTDWLERNKGIRFHLNTIDGRGVFEATRVSDDVSDASKRLTTIPDFSAGKLWEKLPARYFDKLCVGLSEELVVKLKMLTSIVEDDVLLELAIEADGSGDIDHLYDTFNLLRGGSVQEAKARIDLHNGDVTPLDVIQKDTIDKVSSGDEVVMNDDVDAVLFDHFLKTASFQKWMLYLHPSQREFVKRDFNGPARLTGVSGSGKTSVLIHRAVRLAREFPQERILVLTLNRALAKMIKDLTETSMGDDAPKNLVVQSFWELCQEKLLEFEPENGQIYWDKTIKTNKFAIEEHIDEIWSEYYECKNNNITAKVLEPLHRTLINRNIFPSDYIRQEFDYLRSALGPLERKNYIRLEREGRSVPLEERYRSNVIDGLASWESKMTNVGAIDYLGLATALYKHITKIKPIFRCVLVDEMQDFGCVELKIIRALVATGKNDIFLCGDLAQSVLTKYHKLSESGIDIVGRSHSIRKNYRNSREILAAAFELFIQNKKLFSSASAIEILNPEYANFSSSPPLLLMAEDFTSELSYAIDYLHSLLRDENGASRKFCIAICGYNQREIELIAKNLSLNVLTGDTDVVAGQIFVSDLEQTKGFEFDSMIILNCSNSVIPSPALPVEESYREICKLYVAMTRAKTELIVSYSVNASSFIMEISTKFTQGAWDTYASKAPMPKFVFAKSRFIDDSDKELLNMTAHAILYLPEAVGLTTAAQEKLLQTVTGTTRFQNGRQTEWKTFSFFYDGIRRMPTIRNYNGISEGVWNELQNLFTKLDNSEKSLAATIRNSTLSSPKRPILKLKNNV